jgi:WD40 repeat protein
MESNYEMKIPTYKKLGSYKYNGLLNSILELNQGEISCWTDEKLELIKLRDDSLVLTESFPLKTEYSAYTIQLENGNIIHASGGDLTIFDKNFNILEKYEEKKVICLLCKISELSFAVGLSSGRIKIYSKLNSTRYEIKEYKSHNDGIGALLYLPKQNFLLSGSFDFSINVLSLSDEKSIKRLTDHKNIITSLVLLNDETFASSSLGVIKIWSIKAEENKEHIECICIKTLNAHEEIDYIFLYNLANDFMVSKTGSEFIIWDVKNYESLKSYKEDSVIDKFIVTKNQSIVTSTTDNKVNIWQKIE